MSSELRIAISGKSGCGNSTVSGIVAERLGVKLINYTFKSVASELGVSFEEVCQRAENDSKFDLLVDRRQIAMAEEGSCVLGSRLAIWLLKSANLTVHLEASVEVRAQRIQRREGGELDATLSDTLGRDARDRDRYKKLYDIDIDEFDFADLKIDAETLGPNQIADVIIHNVNQKLDHPRTI